MISHAWLYSAIAFAIGLVPCGYLCIVSKDPMIQLIGLEVAGVLETLVILLLAQYSNRTEFYDVALAMAILTSGGALVFVRFLERWE